MERSLEISEEVVRRADGWMTGEVNLCPWGEDIDCDDAVLSINRRLLMQEDCFGEIEFPSDQLLLLVGEGG